MSATKHCESCGMTIDDGTYCHHCVDDQGNLQAFEERFDRMVQWMQRRDSAVSRADAEKQTLAYMRTMPAWRDHPKVQAAQG